MLGGSRKGASCEDEIVDGALFDEYKARAVDGAADPGERMGE